MSLALVVLVTVFTHVAAVGARVAVSLFALHFGASAAVVGVLGALFALLPMFFAVSAGRTIDRVGVRVPMLAGAALAAGGCALAWAWPTLDALYLVSLLVGSGAMLSHVAANSAAGAIGQPSDRARSFTLLALGFSTAMLLGPIFAGLAIDALGHALAFLVLGTFPLVSLLALASSRVRLPRLPLAAPRADRHVIDLLRVRALRNVLAVGVLLSMAWEIFVFVVPIYGTGLGLSASTIGAILSAFAAATFAVRVVLPTLVRRAREWGLVTAALAISGAVFAAFPLVEQVPLLIALAFVLGLGLGMTQPMLMALIYSAAPEGRTGEAVGLRTGLISFSQTAVPLFFGALGAALGMLPVFWSIALVLAVGWAFARRQR